MFAERKEFVAKFDRLTQDLLKGNNADLLSPMGPAPSASHPGGSDGSDGKDEVMDEAPAAPFEEQLKVSSDSLKRASESLLRPKTPVRLPILHLASSCRLVVCAGAYVLVH